ncbi:MAG: universal stress protein [Chloroflexi bacterium]|nr:universal stress protein [Chloroflexota bacterium]
MDTKISKKRTKVLLVEDGLINSQWTAQHMIELTHPDHADIHVIHVLPARKHPIVMTLYMGGVREIHPPALTEKEIEKIKAKKEREGHALLKKTCDLLLKSGLRSTPVLRYGTTLNQIIKYAKEEEIELIVVGADKPKNLRTWRAYNFMRKLMQCSTCPVLIVNRPWQLDSLGSPALDFFKEELQP